jgi:hypothetical protein
MNASSSSQASAPALPPCGPFCAPKKDGVRACVTAFPGKCPCECHVPLAERPGATHARGTWDSSDPTIYELGVWYVTDTGAEFLLLEPPRRVAGRSGYWVGPALLEDLRVRAVEWGPGTRRRGSLARRIARRIAPQWVARAEALAEKVRKLW